VADVHFDHRIALAAIEAGADKIRINPGNIGGAARVKEVAAAARASGVPIRVGVNGGSLEKDILLRCGGPTAEALAQSALRNIDMLRGFGFEDIVLSVKSSDAVTNAKAHILLAERTDVPFHIGITEAGTGAAGERKSALGIGSLLVFGIGDTIRVSLTGDPVPEIAVAHDILRAVGKLPGAVELISCPTCGRCRGDLAGMAATVSGIVRDFESSRVREIKRLARAGAAPPEHLTRTLRVAVMGCEVNGPGEAKNADLGIALSAGKPIYFEKGENVATVSLRDIPCIVSEGLKAAAVS
jgi:(E)-4-hydroxy-3-methylbut-2-enyl-diphosphate synthase